MSESTARQLFELAFAFVTGAALGAMRFPVYILRQVFYRLAALWAVVQRRRAAPLSHGGDRRMRPLHVPSDPAPAPGAPPCGAETRA